jgi:tetraacyldisaccharide 4'-kinase
MKFKKPKFWDKKKPNLISISLLPFTLPIILNNFFLNFKSKKKSNKIKTICIGNIYLGGTGKTPTTIKLYEILKKLNFDVVTAKKFYVSQIDEMDILQKKTNFISSTKRKEIVLKAEKNKNNIVLFDDGLQDKSISYDLNFVCFDADNFIGNGNLIPSGPLREKLNSLIKYDGVFLKIDGDFPENQIKLIKKFNSNINIFETSYEIKNLLEFDLSNNYLIVSGIGNPYSFKKILLKKNFKVVEEKVFPDHYKYTKKDLENIKEHARKLNAKIITTEKDFVKLSRFDSNDIKFIELDLKIKNEENLINFLKKIL